MTRPEEHLDPNFMLGRIYERTEGLPRMREDIDVLKRGHPGLFGQKDSTPPLIPASNGWAGIALKRLIGIIFCGGVALAGIVVGLLRYGVFG